MRHFEQISNNVGHYDPQFCHSGKVAVIIIFSLLVHLWNFWALILLILLKYYPEWQKFCWALDTQWLYRSLWKVFCFCWGLLAPAAANLMWVKKGPIFTHGDDVTIISYTQGATKKGFQCSCQINGVSCRLCPVSTLGLQLPLNNEIPTNHQLPPLLSRFCEFLACRSKTNKAYKCETFLMQSPIKLYFPLRSYYETRTICSFYCAKNFSSSFEM